jgi:O-antigen ligase
MTVRPIFYICALTASTLGVLRTAAYFPSIGPAYFFVIFGLGLIIFSLDAPKVRMDLRYLLLIATIGLSILLNDIPEFFEANQRYIAFCMVVFFAAPAIVTPALSHVRVLTFELFFRIAVFACVGSLLLKFVAPSISNNASGFTGVFTHSMVASPVAALASLYLVHKILNRSKIFIKAVLLLSCVAVCVLAASRTALVALLAATFASFLYMYGLSLKRQLSVLVIAGLVIAVLTPVADELLENISWKMQLADEAGSSLHSREVIWNNRLDEYRSSPLVGVGFGSVHAEDDFDEDSGVVEPGSGWLAVLSMTGLVGFSAFLLVLIAAFWDTLRYRDKSPFNSFLLSVLVFHCCMFIGEGYVYAAGSAMFFSFWLTLGAIGASVHY